MPGTLVDTITKHKFSRAMFDEGGTPHVFMTGVITLRDAVADITASTNTTIGSPIITYAATTGFEVGDYVTLSLGFPSAVTPYKIIAKTATTLTVNVNATSAAQPVTSQIDVQVIDLRQEIPTVQGIIMNPNGGYVFDYDYTNRKFIVYALAATPGDGDPLTAVTTTALGVLTINYIAWGY